MFWDLSIVALLPASAKAFSQVQINPNGDMSQCLTVVSTPADGALLETTACASGNTNQRWSISPGNNPSFQLFGTNFCVDAGSTPQDLVRAKIWTCYPGLSQQTWYYTNDNRIAITGGSQCLDAGSNGQTETHTCATGNTNQVWTVNGSSSSTTTTTATTTTSSSCPASTQHACPATPDPCCAWICSEAQVPFSICSSVDLSGEFTQCTPCSGTTTTTTTTTSATTTTSSSCPTATPHACPATPDSCCAWICAEAQVPFDVCSPTDRSGEFAQCTPCSGSSTTTTTTTSAPTATGQPIHFNGGNTCLTVQNGYAADGAIVALSDCFGAGDEWASLQSWIIQHGSGAVQLAGTNYCLDAGSNPSNLGQAKIWTCYPGLFQQTWYYTGDNRVAITGGNQCLDVAAGSGPVNSKPYGSVQNVQTYECATGDVQQVWTL